MKFLLMASVCFGFGTHLVAQDFTWWNVANNWDGVSSWVSYLEMSSNFLGPNALPVPLPKNGRLHSPFIETGYRNYFARDDQTHGIYLQGVVPLYSERVALQANWMPIEFYDHSIGIRDRRHSRDFDAQGSSVGDLYLGTQIQLVRNHDRMPDILLSINLRTASGSNLRGARHTDSPGYFFDLSLGKTYHMADSSVSVRAFGMMGFYAWQTYDDLHRQNDAFLYGFGADITIGTWHFHPSLGGYHGYLDNGDRPVVYRMKLLKNLKQSLLGFDFGRGLHDFPFTFWGLTWQVHFN